MLTTDERSIFFGSVSKDSASIGLSKEVSEAATKVAGFVGKA